MAHVADGEYRAEVTQAKHFANVTRWINAIGARPAAQKNVAVPQV